MFVSNCNEFLVVIVRDYFIKVRPQYRNAVLEVHVHIINAVTRHEKAEEIARRILIGIRPLLIFAKYVARIVYDQDAGAYSESLDIIHDCLS